MNGNQVTSGREAIGPGKKLNMPNDRSRTESHGRTARRKTFYLALTTAVAWVFYTGVLQAQSPSNPIVYTFGGIGTGSVGTSYFGNAPFSVTVHSDTSKVAIVGFGGGRNIYSAEASLATFTVASIGSGDFTQPTRVFDTQGIGVLGFGLSLSLGGYDMWDFDCPAAGTYDLTGPVGPASATPAPWGETMIDAPTTLGKLSFNSVRNVTFSAAVLPAITCPTNSIVECGSINDFTALVSDPAAAGLAVVWTLDGIAVQTNLLAGGIPAEGTNVSLSAELPVGTNLLEIMVTDTASNSTSCSTMVEAIDTTAPAIHSIIVDPSVLWPPNGEMQPVEIQAVVTDNCGPATWKILRVSSNERDPGEGPRELDWRITGEHTLLLRAERLSRGRGRVYTITIEATDASGNYSYGTATVTVPHDHHGLRTGKRGPR
jgi:hypothetical protein